MLIRDQKSEIRNQNNPSVIQCSLKIDSYHLISVP